MLGYTPQEQTPREQTPWEQTLPPGADTPTAQSMLGDMVNARAVRILLECNLVKIDVCLRFIITLRQRKKRFPLVDLECALYANPKLFNSMRFLEIWQSLMLAKLISVYIYNSNILLPDQLTCAIEFLSLSHRFMKSPLLTQFEWTWSFVFSQPYFCPISEEAQWNSKIKRSLRARAWGIPLGPMGSTTEVAMKRVTKGHQMDQSN